MSHEQLPLKNTRDPLATCLPGRMDRYEKKAQLVSSDERKGKLRAAIRLKCLECCCWQEAEVRDCSIVDCALWGLGGQKI